MKKMSMGRVTRMLAVASLVGGMMATISVASVDAGAATKYSKTLACEVTDTGGVNDHSFNQSAYLGLKQAAGVSKNITPKVLSSVQSSDYVNNINTFETQGCNIIITVGFLMADATWNAAVGPVGATAAPNYHFAIVDNTNANPGNGASTDNTCTYCSMVGGSQVASNLLGLTYETSQDAFLGGFEAAATSKTGKVATYGGMQFGSVTTYMDGFYDGVMYYNAKFHKHVQVLGWNEATQTGTFIGSFTDTTTAASDTTAFLQQGASTVFPVAGSDGLGTTSAVKTWNASHPSAKANVEWVDTNGCSNDAADCNIFLSSVTKGVTASVKAAVLLQASGKFHGGNYVGTLKNGGVQYIMNNKAGTAGGKVTAAVKAQVNALVPLIEKGSIKIPTGGAKVSY